MRACWRPAARGWLVRRGSGCLLPRVFSPYVAQAGSAVPADGRAVCPDSVQPGW